MTKYFKPIRLNSNINNKKNISFSRHDVPVSCLKEFSEKCLNKIYDAIQKALDQYARVFVIRIELKYPYIRVKPEDEITNAHIQRFIASLEARIKICMARAGELHDRVEGVEIRYAWAEDCCKEGRPKYHLLLLLNANAFCMLGYFKGGLECMRNRLVSVWADALRLAAGRCPKLVYVSKSAIYCLDETKLSSGMQDISGSCKFISRTAAKRYGYSIRSFGCSDK